MGAPRGHADPRGRSISVGLIVRVLIFVAILTGDADGAERLVYATRHEDANRRQHPDVVWTRVSALDPTTGETHQLFSDEGSALMLLHRHGMPSSTPLAAWSGG